MASSFVAVPAPEGGYRPLKGEDPFPLVAPAESTPLVLKREGLACAKSVLSRGFVVGVVACALCVWALAALRSAGVARRRRGAAPAARRHKYCVAHAAYGDYLPVAEITAASKRSYANARGYAFHELLGATREDYVAAHCPELGAQIHGAFSKTTPVKACGLWASLRDACDYVLWTDADAVVVDDRVRIEDLLGLDADAPEGRAAAPPTPGEALPNAWPDEPTDALLFLNEGCPGGAALDDGACGTPRAFANCVNTGSLVLKSGPFAEAFLRQQLAMAHFDNAFLEASPCSTAGFDADIPEWDQCMFDGRTEQCTLECLYRARPSLFNATRCALASPGRDYLAGVLLEDRYQELAYGAAYTSANFTAFLRSLPDAPDFPGYDGTLVFNCMGGEPDQKVACANAATYAYFPPLRDAVLADAFLHA